MIKKTIDIKPQSKADFTANDVCETDSVVFINKSKDATGYNWRFGDGKTSSKENPKHKFQITSSTTFNITLVALVTNGCADSVSKAVTINQNPVSAFSFSQSGQTVDLKANKTGLSSYKWKFGTTDSITKTTATHSHTLTGGQYTVCLTVTDNVGCTSQTCKDVTVGISSLTKQSGIKIYPNPNSGSFEISIENPEKDLSISIYNSIGELVKTISGDSSQKNYFIHLESANGIYLVRVRNRGTEYQERIVVSR